MLAAGGLYAPSIRYHDGTFYIVCTNILNGDQQERQNFILSTDDIWSEIWSDAVPFEFDGIDPSLFWDDDGRSYLQASAAPGPMTTVAQF